MKRLGVTGDGRVVILDEETPAMTPRKVLVRTHYSGISAGTETRNMLDRRKKPVDGKEPYAFGYSDAGVVDEAGTDAKHVSAGQRVACYGGPYVRHAEQNAVPRNLVHPLPEGVTLKDASFVGVGAIAAHAVRRGRFELGEKVLVVGLGILGNITAQVLSASGVDVLASELLTFRRDKAEEVGIHTVDPAKTDLKSEVDKWTGGVGVDGAVVLINSDNVALVNQVLDLCREKGRVVLVGGGGMNFDRDKVFQKELDVLVPRAGGPGRYNPWYEEEGNDPPIGYVRWTEGRNMQAWLWLLGTGRMKIAPLITHEFAFEKAAEAFDLLIGHPDEALGVVLRFPAAEES
jgi:2-desacetyl-2-hydroxyethyl bacteriochlorophyllide A dehydrogenase